MEKRERYAVAVLAIVFLAIVGYLVFSPSPDEEKVKIHADPEFAASLAESNAVILRLYFPYTNTAGPGTATTYATQVFIFAGKTVILQVIDGNECIRTSFTPTPEDKNVVEKNEMVLSPQECIAESAVVPTIEMRQAPEDRITQTPLVTKVDGKPEDIPLMVRYVILKVYSNADEIVQYAGSIVSQAFKRR